MKESVNKLKIFLYSMLGLTLLCTALFTVSMFVAFDADVGYFSNTSILPRIQNALVIVSIIFFASITFLIPKDSLPCQKPSNVVLTVFSSLFCGFVYISGMIITFLSTYNNAANMSSFQKYIFLIIVISGLIAAFHFIYDALAPEKSGLTLKTVSAVFVIINLLDIIIFEHVDYTVAINTPRKVLLFLSFISVAVFIVQELRFKVGIHQPRAYIFFGSVATLLCAIMSVSGLIAHYAGAFKDSSFLIYYLIGLAFAVYISTKLLSYMKYVEYIAESSDGDNESNEKEA